MLRREQAREALAAGRRLRHVPEQERINSADIERRLAIIRRCKQEHLALYGNLRLSDAQLSGLNLN